MSRLLVFFGVALTLVGGIHLYFWLRLVRSTALPSPYRAWATGALIALGLTLPLAFFLGRVLPRPARTWLAWPAFVWMGVMFLLFVLLIGTEVVRLALAAYHAGAGAPPSPARRTAIARVLGMFAGGAAGLLGSYGLIHALTSLHVKSIRVKLPRLPQALEGLRIVQLTDVHLGPTIGRSFTERIVGLANAEKPDIIAITGDLVDGSVEELRESAAPLRQLEARYGVFFVTGNHEYYSGVEAWLIELQRLGIRVLRNEHVLIGEPGAQVVLAGVDDASAHSFGNGHGADVEAALAGAPADAPTVLLAHQPKTVRQAAKLRVDLQISGHTHGGQIWPFSYLVKLDQPVVQGLTSFGATQIYVSPGTGYWGPPLRLGTQAEITRLELHSA